MAVLLTWGLFLLWAVIGMAVLRLARHRWTLPALLLAPTVGFAAVLVPTYILVRFGVPVRLCGPPVLLALLAASAVVLWRLRPARVRAAGLWRQGRVFALVLAGAFTLTAWPLAVYGFDWVANGNDDMAYYCLAATGYLDHGYASVPTLEELTAGRDNSKSLWFFYILGQVRPSEISVALASSYTGLTAQQVFMPVIVALNLALVAAASALAAVGAGRRAALCTGTMLAVSAATTYGVVQQVLGQVGGLALLCAALALVSGRFRRVPAGVLLPRACACGLVFAGLLIYYPEVIPILVGGCIVLGVRDLIRGRLDRRHLVHAGAAILVMAALLPVYLYGATRFLAGQAGANGNSPEIRELFPYYLTPRGPALLWGLLPISGPAPAALQNACVLIGFLLLAWFVVPAARDLLRRRAFAAAFGVIAVLIAFLYVRGAAFGLFKIAMFAQPFLWAVVGAWVARRRRWALRGALLLLLVVAALNARTQFWYVDQSRGAGYRVELPAVTTRHGLAEFRARYHQYTASGSVDRVFLATDNTVLMKLLAAEVRDVPATEVGIALFSRQVRLGLGDTDGAPWTRTHPEWKERLLSMGAELADRHARNRPRMLDPDTGGTLHELYYPDIDRGTCPPERVLVAGGGGGLSILNRQQFPEDGPPIICKRLSELHNFAVFCDATGARQFYLGLAEPRAVAAYQLERDVMLRQHTLAGVGRAMVLEVFNPSPRVRVLVSHTSSSLEDPDTRSVAPVKIVGDRRVALGGIGFGAERLVSPPLATQAVGANQLLAVEFGPVVYRPANHLAVLEQLWGSELPRDRRYLTGHAREISVLSEEEYNAFRPPQAVSRFPDDLAHPHLEYSGFFEEGWIGTRSKARLTQTEANQECVIRGVVPAVPDSEGFSTELTVLLDGTEVAHQTLHASNFEVRAPGGTAPGPHWIELRFSHTQVLPYDGRKVSARITFLGFEPINEALAHPPQYVSEFPTDLTHPKLEPSGIHTDGWTGKTFRAHLWQAAPGGTITVRGQIPEIAGNGAFRTELTVLVDGVEAVRQELGTGDFEVRAPAGKTPQARWIECRFTSTQTLPPPDNRGVGAHLRFLGFEPQQGGP
jgi:hypothetical protein